MSAITDLRKGAFLALLLGLLALLLFHRTALLAPNSHMAAIGGDGLKNYFSYAWHVEHDTAATVFSGMNAPFGEHINYPDAQPLLSNLHRAVDAVWTGSDQYSVGVVNLLMLLSLPVCALLLFLVLHRSGMPWHLAAIAGVALALSTVQGLRSVQAHYALAYTWALPLAIWAGLRHWTHPRPWRSALLIVAVLFALLSIHVYLGFISSALLLAWSMVGAVGNAGRVRKLTALAAPVVALLLFQGFTKLTDLHTHRTEHPTGFFDYQANALTLLVPDHQWISPLARLLPGAPATEVAENWAYLGLGTLLMAALLVVAAVLHVVRERGAGLPKQLAGVFDPYGLGGLFLASIPFLLVALGMPFNDGNESLLWDTPVFRQFRAPGRFAWAFFYALGLFVVWRCWRLFEAGRPVRSLGIAGLVLGIGLQLYEGSYIQAFIGREFVKSSNLFRREQLSPEEQRLVDRVWREKAVGIASIPYFHNGSEEFLIPVHEEGLRMGQLVAYHTGLPMMSSSLTRTGLEEVRAGIAAFGPSWYPRPTLPHWRGEDSLVILAFDDKRADADHAIMARAVLLDRVGSVQVAKIAVKDLLRDERASTRQKKIAELASSYKSGAWYFSRPDTFLFHDSYESGSSPHVLAGAGALAGAHGTFTQLAEFPPNTFQGDRQYVASFWYYNRGAMRCHALAGIDEFDEATGQGYWDHYTNPRFSRTLVGDWSLVEIPFTVRDPQNRIKVFVDRFWYQPLDTVFVDELLVRQADVSVLRYDADSTLWWNGHPLRK